MLYPLTKLIHEGGLNIATMSIEQFWPQQNLQILQSLHLSSKKDVKKVNLIILFNRTLTVDYVRNQTKF